MNGSVEEARRLLIFYAGLAWRRGLCCGSGGNISLRWQEGLLVSRSGVSLRAMGPEDILYVAADGSAPAAPPGCRPSVETAFHAAIYQARPGLNAVLHTHSTYATLFAAAGREIPLRTAPARQLLKSTPLVPYAEPGSPQLCAFIEDTLAAAPPDMVALLLAGHGAVALGADPEAAFNTAELLEESARIAWLLEQAGR